MASKTENWFHYKRSRYDKGILGYFGALCCGLGIVLGFILDGGLDTKVVFPACLFFIFGLAAHVRARKSGKLADGGS